MKVLKDSYQDISDKIRSKNLNIVIYGAGMIGNVFMPYWICEYNLCDKLLFYVDQDEKKQQEGVWVGGRKYLVKAPEVLRQLPQNTIIFVTNSNYSPIIKMMDNMKELDDVDVYVVPILQVCNRPANNEEYIVRLSEKQMIPKKIHYCWFSRNPMPDYLQKCVDTWYKYCPDYEIIRWDEDNYDVGKNMYMRQAYQMKKWGFVPDIARLDILYQHGGIYLDTDVELIRNLDELLYQSAFVGVEKWGNVNMGGCSGAVAGHPMIKHILECRENEKFIYEDGSLNLKTCGYYETIPFINKGMKPDNTIQQVGDVTILSSDFFHPYDYMSGDVSITKNTYSIHHFNGGWIDSKGLEERKKTQEEYCNILKRMEESGN